MELLPLGRYPRPHRAGLPLIPLSQEWGPLLGIVFTFCYVSPASNYFIDGLFGLLKEFEIGADFVRLSCDFDEHVRRVTSDGRKNTNKIQSKEYLEDYLGRFDFSVDIPGVQTLRLDNSELSIRESALEIERQIVT